MALMYSYTAYSPDGELKHGEVAAPNEGDALDSLALRGLSVLSISSARSAKPMSFWRKDITIFQNSPKYGELAGVFQTLSLLMNAGFPLHESIGIVSLTTNDSKLSAALTEFRNELMAGKPISEAAATLDNVTPKEFAAFWEIGDVANRLADTLGDAAIILRTRHEASEKIRTALIYPFILVIAFGALLGVLVFFLAPALEPIFLASEVEPSRTLRILFSMNQILINDWEILLVSIIALIGGIISILQVDRVRAVIKNAMLLIPIVQKFRINLELAELCRSMMMLMKSGMPFQIAAQRIAARSSGLTNKILVTAVENSKRGASISTAFSIPLVPPMLYQLMKSAEQSNNWVPLLETAAKLYEKSASRQRDRLLEMVAPALTITIGSLIGFIMLSVVGAIFSVNDLAFR